MRTAEGTVEEGTCVRTAEETVKEGTCVQIFEEAVVNEAGVRTVEETVMKEEVCVPTVADTMVKGAGVMEEAVMEEGSVSAAGESCVRTVRGRSHDTVAIRSPLKVDGACDLRDTYLHMHAGDDGHDCVEDRSEPALSERAPASTGMNGAGARVEGDRHAGEEPVGPFGGPVPLQRNPSQGGSEQPGDVLATATRQQRLGGPPARGLVAQGGMGGVELEGHPVVGVCNEEMPAPRRRNSAFSGIRLRAQKMMKVPVRTPAQCRQSPALGHSSICIPGPMCGLVQDAQDLKQKVEGDADGER